MSSGGGATQDLEWGAELPHKHPVLSFSFSPYSYLERVPWTDYVMWGCTSVNPTKGGGRLRQEDLEFKAILSYVVV